MKIPGFGAPDKHLPQLASERSPGEDPRRIAIIDMGSNSFRLIVIEYVPRLSFKLVDEVREVVRLSEGMAETGFIRAPAIERALRASHLYATFCAASGIHEIVAVGTSALRDASNSAGLLARIQAETGLSVRVLSGEEEATYGYLAAINSTTLTDGFVLDLGGGSVQIMRVERRRLAEHRSFPLGAVRMTEQFLPNDPPKSKDLDRLSSHVIRQFASLDWFHTGQQPLIGIGGNVRLLARMAQKSAGYSMDELHGYTVTAGQLDGLSEAMARTDLTGRRRLPGMKSDRADIALAGAVVVREAMRASGSTALTVSSQSVREGLFYERFLAGTPTQPPLFDDVRRASVLNLAHVYHFQEAHTQHVAHLTTMMFDQLDERMGCSPVERELLWAASMLHDIGVTIDYNDHHKHGAYLILNAGLPGYTHREIALIALMTRYHRKGMPALDELKGVMLPGDEKRLLKLSTLLRIAEFLDRARDGAVTGVRFRFGGDVALMELIMQGDSRMALWAVEQHRDLFRHSFGLDLQAVAVHA